MSSLRSEPRLRRAGAGHPARSRGGAEHRRPGRGPAHAGVLVLGLLAGLAGVAGAAGAPLPPGRENTALKPYRLPLDWKHFYSYAETVATVKKLEKTFPELCDAAVIGKSLQGRDLWALSLGNKKTGPLDGKPAMYVDGNIHGNEIQGTEICLYLAWTLLNRYGSDRRATELLDTRTVYIVPTVNPDARVAFFETAQNPNTPRWNYRPHDDDGDGVADEDGARDIDGDGRILTMRRRDPYGRLKTGPDPRQMVPVAPGEKGEWTVLGTEGVDQDGDGRVGEDPPGGVDLNRNFPALWKPRYEQFGAGDFPFSEPETRAVGMFIYRHRNIAAVQSFHNNGNLILHPPGVVGDTALPARDLAIYKAIAERGEKLLPGYKRINGPVDLYPVNGSTLDWAYYVCGAMAFTNEIWNLPREFVRGGEGPAEGEAGPSSRQEDQLRFLDALTPGDGFINWKPFRHPQYGDIELGGYDQFSTRIPPVDYLEDICQRNTQFVLFHAESTPRLEMAASRLERVTDGVWKLELDVANSGLMDTYPEGPRQTGAYRPVIAELRVPAGVTVVEGQPVQPFSPLVDQSRDPRPGTARRNEARVDLGTIQGNARKTVRWLIVAPGGRVTVRVSGEKAGTVEREIELR